MARLYECPACTMRFESWNHCNVHMHHCCPHLRFDHLGKRQKAKRFRVRNFQAVAAPKLSRTLTTTERAVAEASASMPFMCPAHGCGERYETRESCERHLKVCARVIAHHHRKDEATQLRPAFVGGGGSTICNTAWGEPNTTVDISDEAFEFFPPSRNDHDGNPMPFMRGNNQNVIPADMANVSLGRVSKLAPHPGHSNGNTYTDSPYPQLPEQFGSYNCLRCSRGYTNWVDCVAHMVGCCNQIYENGKLWGGVEAVRIRCGVEEPSSKKCTHCGSFKTKHDFASTEWAEIGEADRIRQCKDCYGR